MMAKATFETTINIKKVDKIFIYIYMYIYILYTYNIYKYIYILYIYIYISDLSWLRYKCDKFHNCGTFVKDFRDSKNLIQYRI